jgi:uncharacterized membrane protein YdjX (TVP38/TMEM64 family)
MQEPQRTRSSPALIITSLVVLTVLGGLLYLAWPFVATLSDPEQMRRLIGQAGAWGPLVFIGVQVLQVLIAPIPGQVAVVVGGYLFGPFWGLVYTLIGATIGSLLVFTLARKLGRPFVERFVSSRQLDRFDSLTKRNGILIFFLIFLLPGFPDDVIAFVAGLTAIPIRTLLVVSLAGRLPGYAVLAMTGNGLTSENLNPVVIAVTAMLLVLALAVWKRAWFHEDQRRPCAQREEGSDAEHSPDGRRLSRRGASRARRRPDGAAAAMP